MLSGLPYLLNLGKVFSFLLRKRAKEDHRKEKEENTMDRSIEKKDKAEKGRLLRELPTRIRDGYIESKVSVEIGLMDLASLELGSFTFGGRAVLHVCMRILQKR
ncbi:hypothetical protein EV1_003686 [Malus domestica]|nr:uncharacterized protein LOC108169575 [Malus domestica]